MNTWLYPDDLWASPDEALRCVSGQPITTSYIGSKRKLLEWIWRAVPSDITSILDAFSGSSSVAYMLKAKGLGVSCCDRLAYAYHVGRALVENDTVTLSDARIGWLLLPSRDASDFVQRIFHGKYFRNGVHTVIDQVRSRIGQLSNRFERSLALCALGKTCIQGKRGFGHFSTSKVNDEGDTPAQFRDRFADICTALNAMVFAGARRCRALHGDVARIAPRLRPQAAYFDPPYATEYSCQSYENAYHFVEGLMTCWRGRRIIMDSTTRHFEMPQGITRTTADEFFRRFLTASQHIPAWLLSYRDHSIPDERGIKALLRQFGRDSRMRSKRHRYTLAPKAANNDAWERLFVCWPAGSRSHAEVLRDELTDCLMGDAA